MRRRTYVGKLLEYNINELADIEKISIQTIVNRLKAEIFALNDIDYKGMNVKMDGIEIHKTEGAWMRSQERRVLINERLKD